MDHLEQPLNIVLFGPPGAGKGTQADRVAARHGIPKISTGEILRNAIAEGARTGEQVKASLQRGGLVSDEVMIEIVRDRLSQPDTEGGFVLDGFPRTVPQAVALDSLLASRAPLIVIALVVHKDEVVRRLGRRGREDDDEPVIRERLDLYSRETQPVLEYYRQNGVVIVLDGNRPSDAVSLAIEAAILTINRRPPRAHQMPGKPLGGFVDSDLSLEFLRVVEQAAMAAGHTMGQGDRHASDHAAVNAMRRELDTAEIDGTIVIGEGERDEAPMLYIGEKVGRGGPKVDIAVDPLEGTNLCATGISNSIAVLAAAPKGGLLHAPDLYMEKLIVGPSSKHAVNLDAPVADNLNAIAKCLNRRVEDLLVMVLDRPRHERLIREIRATRARICLMGDGDLSAGIAAAVVGTGVHAVMGIGGAPEGVLTAAAMRCLNGEIFARLVINKPEDEDRCRAMGIADPRRVYKSADLASGDSMIFAATGVTDGHLLKGVRFFGDGTRTSSLIMQTNPHRIRFVDSIHVTSTGSPKIRF